MSLSLSVYTCVMCICASSIHRPCIYVCVCMMCVCTYVCVCSKGEGEGGLNPPQARQGGEEGGEGEGWMIERPQPC